MHRPPQGEFKAYGRVSPLPPLFQCASARTPLQRSPRSVAVFRSSAGLT